MKAFGSNISNIPSNFAVTTPGGRSLILLVLVWIAAAVLVFVSLAQLSTPALTQIGYSIAFASIVLGIVHFGSRLYRPQFQGSGSGRHFSPRDDDRVSNSGDFSNEDLFRSAFTHAAGMAIVSPTGRWLTVNPAICEALGFEQSQLIARSFQDIVHPDDLGTLLINLDRLINGGNRSCQLEQRYIHNLGHTVWMLATISLIRNTDDEPLYLVCQFQDISRRKEAEERLVHDVFHDALTGLPNRALFMDRLRLTMERARRRQDRVFAVLFLDLDDFKVVNDSQGHMIGDQLLMEVARRLKSCLRTTDTVARLGGDEFTILLEDLTCESESRRIVERFQRELARPFEFGTHDLKVTASIGVACNTAGDYESAEDILRDADAAMYRAKTAGKATYEVVNTGQFENSMDVGSLEADLAKAIERGDLQLAYQPIISLESGTFLGVEALARWKHPEHGLISPADFVPIAEGSGSIVRFGKWVLHEACTQLNIWESRFPYCRSLSVNVNVSIAHLMQADLVDDVVKVLEETKIEPRRLKLELTESLLIQNVDAAIAVLQQLRALGVEVCIDDFGTGYSSLSYLHQLPVTSVKIDSSFVRGMVENNDHSEIVKTIISLAKGLRMKVIAEGVETLEQLNQLWLLKCDAGQGFLFSKARAPQEIEALLALQRQWQTIIMSLNATPTAPASRNLRHVAAVAQQMPRLRAV